MKAIKYEMSRKFLSFSLYFLKYVDIERHLQILQFKVICTLYSRVKEYLIIIEKVDGT